MSEHIEPVNLSALYECLDMDAAITSTLEAGGSPESAEAIKDLVASGAYHVGEAVQEGTYAIYRLVPIIVREDGITAEPIEFGAAQLMPEHGEWARSAESMLDSSAAAGQGRIRRFIGRKAVSAAFALSTRGFDTPRLEEIEDAVGELPSGMLGGVLMGGRIYPLPEDGSIHAGAMAFWHRSLPLALPDRLPEEGLDAEWYKRRVTKTNEIMGSEEARSGIALTYLYRKAERLPEISLPGNVNLKLPPQRFLR